MSISSETPFHPLLFRAHPWHGVSIGAKAPEEVMSYIEIVPTDTVKYEVDKATGHLKVDRPQKFSNTCPTLYGFVPQTWCGPRIGAYCGEKIGREGVIGDGDPLDICVLAERAIPHGDLLLRARPIGGLRMIDGNEADDKIIAVLVHDGVYNVWHDLQDMPKSLLDRLRHYFLTYKEVPGETLDKPKVEIPQVYGREESHHVIRLAQQDYLEKYGQLAQALEYWSGRHP